MKDTLAAKEMEGVYSVPSITSPWSQAQVWSCLSKILSTVLLVSMCVIQPCDGFSGSSLTCSSRVDRIQSYSTLPTAPTRRSSTHASPIGKRRSSPSRLYQDLWDRMGIEAGEGPQWYLLNCVAGLEMELLTQCRLKCQGMQDVVKFVVPTVVKTRSHGANRMVRENKVRCPGYVFAKLRLTKETYGAIQEIDLCRSWMGTINKKGNRKLPPVPVALSQEEIESFDLENPQWEKVDDPPKRASKGKDSLDIIHDTEENERRELQAESEMDEIVSTVYGGFKVEDMVKVTAKNRFFDEDGIVRRLKDGKLLIRFFTYGTIYDEWLDPSDVRKLTNIEIVKGLGGPSAPITQRDLDGPQRYKRDRMDGRGSSFDDDRRYQFDDRRDRRNQVNAFGSGGSRNRRQDSNARHWDQDKQSDDLRERDNWNWYKDNERRNQPGGYADGNLGIQESRPRNDNGRDRDNRSWAEGDVNSQWGRDSPRQNSVTNRREQRPLQQGSDWNSFVSQPPAPNKKKDSPSKQETGDFFESLMMDLSRDIDGNQRSGGVGGRSQWNDNTGLGSGDADDDFFASLMSEISSVENEKKSSTPQSGVDNDDDDFFASLERDIRQTTKTTQKTKSPPKHLDAEEELDDFFAGIEAGGTENDTTSPSESDDFFASLEQELASELMDEKKESNWRPQSSIQKSSNEDLDVSLSPDDDDFFSSLESELRLDLEDPTGTPEPQRLASTVPPTEEADVLDSFFSAKDMETLSPAWPTPSETMPAIGDDSPAGDVAAPAQASSKPTPTRSSNDGDLQKHTIIELKEMLRERGLKVTGKKAELIERLTGS